MRVKHFLALDLDVQLSCYESKLTHLIIDTYISR